jgi:hypothetical protein
MGAATGPVDGGAFTLKVLAHAGNRARGAPVSSRRSPPVEVLVQRGEVEKGMGWRGSALGSMLRSSPAC